MSDHLIAEANRHARALTIERDQIRTELALLREWQREVIQNANAHGAERRNAIARAEKAEAELARLRTALHSSCDAEREMSVSEGPGHSTCGLADELTKRAERAEAEVSRLTDALDLMRDEFLRIIACPGCNAEIEDLANRAQLKPVQTVSVITQRDRAEAELASERARLDYMSTRGFEHRHHETGDHLGYEWTISSYSESEDVTLRDVIDAEMREEAK